MDLIKYLNDNFYTRQELLDVSKITELQFSDFQKQSVMPACSYKLKLNLISDSFFGEHTQSDDIEYYAKGYVAWLGSLQVLSNTKDAYSLFSDRYKIKIKQLNNDGFVSKDTKLNQALDLHIQEEWGHFLNGIYGLCTKSGLPEDIASKEVAITLINALIVKDKLSKDETIELKKAVTLLDNASSFFAPHEREKSSRHRLIDEVRRQYKLER